MLFLGWRGYLIISLTIKVCSQEVGIGEGFKPGCLQGNALARGPGRFRDGERRAAAIPGRGRGRDRARGRGAHPAAGVYGAR